MNAYKHLNNNKKSFLTRIDNYDNNNISINWKNVRELIKCLSLNEHESICNLDKIRDKMYNNLKNKISFKNLENTFQSLPLLDRSKEKYINPYEKYWENRYYNVLFNIEYDEKRIKEICINYLEGLEWTLNYYCNKCIDYYCKYKYNYPPLLCDLFKYVPYFDIKFIQNNKNKPLNSIVQLAYVVPYSSLNLLPDNISNILKQNYNHFYNSEFEIEWSFCRYFWESHINLYDIHIEKLVDIIKLNS